MRFTRRAAVIAATLGAIGVGALARYAPWRARDGRPPKDAEKIRRDREFDWATWLGEWDREARLAVARMLVRFGVTGPDGEWYGYKDYFRKQAAKAGRQVSEEVMAPLPHTGELDLDAADRLMADARERVAELKPYVFVEDYRWLVINNNGLGFPAASIADLDSARTKFGAQLPHAFSQFLRVSNGWISLLVRLLPIGEAGRFGERDPVYVAGWSTEGHEPSDREYFVYGKEQSPVHYRGSYVRDCVLISEPVLEPNDRVLLNPAVQFSDGEWETWFMAPYLPGAIRYQSFIEVMEHLRRQDTEHYPWLTGERGPTRPRKA